MGGFLVSVIDVVWLIEGKKPNSQLLRLVPVGSGVLYCAALLEFSWREDNDSSIVISV
jgi:hypothetical protein